MIIFTLLLLTITGIHADAWLGGDQYEFSYNVNDGGLNLLGTFYGCAPQYQFNKFNITRDLGYTSWDKFLEDYKYADFANPIHIEFARRDRQGKTFDRFVTPRQIELSKVRLSSLGALFERTDQHFVIVSGPSSTIDSIVLPGKEYAFQTYDQKLFDETIWVDLSRLHGEVHVSVEGYKKDDHLILAVIYKFECSEYASTSGWNFRLTGQNHMYFRSGNPRWY